MCFELEMLIHVSSTSYLGDGGGVIRWGMKNLCSKMSSIFHFAPRWTCVRILFCFMTKEGQQVIDATFLKHRKINLGVICTRYKSTEADK